ncbi:MAG: hypothetical protein ACTS7E_01505 [Arsenophonus sp. NC-CH8-MAG3]
MNLLHKFVRNAARQLIGVAFLSKALYDLPIEINNDRPPEFFMT